MKIIDQNLQLSSQHYALQESHRERVHETFVNGQLATRDAEQLSKRNVSASQHHLQMGQSADKPPLNPNRTLADVTEQRLPNRENFTDRLAPNHNVQATGIDNQITLPPRLLEMIEAVEAMMERLTGESYTLKVMGYEPENKSEENDFSNTYPSKDALPTVNTGNANTQDLEPSTGERWVFSQSYQEIEETNFQAQGRVTTADGREIEFSVQSQMYRNFSSHLHIEKQEGVVLKDPLVVNLEGSPAQLTVDKFAFDLDADGYDEEISFVHGNSGFLAFDQNQDGIVNNGKELFGAMTGNGFNELAQFDEDKNGWIDENDAIFSQLQIWQKDSNGFDQLSGLLEMNIGAISLASIDTEFSLKDEQNQQHGQIVSSGVYLKESGSAGTIQQIDLVV